MILTFHFSHASQGKTQNSQMREFDNNPIQIVCEWFQKMNKGK